MKIRIKFRKTGIMKFIGHLDVMRYFQKVNRRAGVDIVFSGGFSPHQIMSFAAPLGLGLTSQGEYLDMEVKSCGSSESMIRKMNDVMADGMEILSFRRLPDQAKTAMSVVAAAEYFLGPREDVWDNWQMDMERFLHQETIMVLKKTKKNEKEVDIRPLIYNWQMEENGVRLMLAAGSMDNLKPELLLEAFFRYGGRDYIPYSFFIHRLELYAWSGEGKDRNLKALEDFGEDIL